MANETKAVAVRPGDGATIQGPVGGALNFKVRGDQTAGALTALENVIPPGEGPPLHVHANEDESWFVIEGDLRFKLGDEISSAPQGSFVFVPRGVPHNFQNIGEQPARILVMFNPSGMEAFFERFAELEAPDPGAFKTLGAEVGMDVVGPPLAQSHPD
jgi:mannose-6-phosphate isomerase-like protein (cupin superfamily)